MATHAQPLLSDPGGQRAVAVRWVVIGELVLSTATRLGGRSGSPVDMPVLRDARAGAPLLTGSTLAGALQSHLADRLAGYREPEPPDAAGLFGGLRGDDQGSQSPLIVFDGVGALNGHVVEIRDSVKLLSDRGTAEPHKKFDGEVLPAGTTFPLRFDLLVSEVARERDLISRLTQALAGLSEGEISLGARRSRGMGRLTSRGWKAKRFDLTSAGGWLEWLTSDAIRPLQAVQPAHETAAAAVGSGWLPAIPNADRRRRVRVDATLMFEGGLLVRTPGRTADAPDVVHLQSGGQSVLPGTSLTGALRNRAHRIARLVHSDPTSNAASRCVEELFGPELQGTTDPSFQPRASRLRVSENVVTGGLRQRPTRIRVDRFTQGVFESALFDEEPHYGGHVELRLELRDPTEAQVGFLLLLVKDLLAGDFAIGGTGSVGRGIARGTANLTYLGGPEDGGTIRLDPEQTPQPEDSAKIEAAITAFRTAKAKAASSAPSAP